VTKQLENGLTIVLGACIVALTISALRPQGTSQAAAPTRRAVDGWPRLVSEGARMGDSAAPVQIVEFSDFQCPACGAMRATLAALREKYPDQVAVVYRHFPLQSIHPVARAAAIAAECARTQGKFAAYHDALFASQPELPRQPWTRLAQQAGIPDTARFAACLSSDAAAARVSADAAAGEAIGINATPTLIIDGQLDSGMSPEALSQWVDERLCSKTRGRVRCWIDRVL
jgi:protein-disulfide isomerase